MKCLGATFLTFSLVCVTAVVAAEPLPGIVAAPPASGPSVKTELGYMVPYTMTIPGTEAQMTMIPIPGGKFKMGSPDSELGRHPHEGPQFEVTVNPFWMGKYEVTWAEYRSYMALYGIFKEFESRKVRPVDDSNRIDAITAPTELYDPSYTFEFGETPNLPAVTMTQYAARQYTKWVSGVTGHFYRLPTEAEWEYACRAGTDTSYSFGDDVDDLDDYGWYYDNADDAPHPVGEKKPNAFGLYDMHGNAAEWTMDQVFEDGYARFASGTVKADEPLVWPTELESRAIRGGSWESDPEDCRSAARLPSQERDWKQEDPNLPLSPWWFTSDPTRGIGFRVMRPLQAPPTKEAKERFWQSDAVETTEGVDNRMQEGRGAMGVVDPTLPDAIKQLQENR